MSKKTFLKIYGNRVNLDEIERMIKTKFDSIDVASAGKDDHLYIFLTEDKFADDVRECKDSQRIVDNLKRFCKLMVER